MKTSITGFVMNYLNENCTYDKIFLLIPEMNSGPRQAYTMEQFYENSSWLLAVNSLSASPTKWSNTIKPFVGSCRGIILV